MAQKLEARPEWGGQGARRVTQWGRTARLLDRNSPGQARPRHCRGDGGAAAAGHPGARPPQTPSSVPGGSQEGRPLSVLQGACASEVQVGVPGEGSQQDPRLHPPSQPSAPCCADWGLLDAGAHLAPEGVASLSKGRRLGCTQKTERAPSMGFRILLLDCESLGLLFQHKVGGPCVPQSSSLQSPCACGSGEVRKLGAGVLAPLQPGSRAHLQAAVISLALAWEHSGHRRRDPWAVSPAVKCT